MAVCENSSAAINNLVEYPPYPDVWDWKDGAIQSTSIFIMPNSMYTMPNGDVLIQYYKKYTKRKKMDAYAVTFFERINYVGTDAENIVKVLDQSKEKKKKEKGESAKFDYMQYNSVSQDGVLRIESIIPYDLNCYAGPNRYPYKLINKKTGEEKIFSIFRLLDKPEKFFVNGISGKNGTKDYGKELSNASCIYEAKRTVKYQVKGIEGNFKFLLDNSFLFQDMKTGVVIRIDSNLKSKSNIVGKDIFIIENSGTPWVMDDLTNNDYENCDEDIAEKTTNDLYKYLRDRRRK